jgi:diacylglycerol kinase (ATP)
LRKITRMVYFIYNPNSGNKSNRYRQKLINTLQKIPSSELLITEYPNHAHEIAQRLININPSKIIVIGGDGTVNEVGNALNGTKIPLGIIPLGSGNGLARHLKIPMNSSKALYVALNGNKIAIDVLTWNEKAFFCTAGIGFDAQVASLFQRGKRRGILNYIKATLKSVINYKPVDISIGLQTSQPYFSVTIANANQFGNNAYISPFSDLQDALFEVVKIKKGTLLQIVQLGISLFSQTIHLRHLVDIQKTNSLILKVPIGTKYHLDGESLKTTYEEINIKIFPGQLQVISGK